ncbi:cytochrome P450 [Aureobasidium subglaciale]|nr:cytochrome P450 [Aureobasidium subglaciale]
MYAGGFEKGDWYSSAFSAYGSVHNMFSMEKRDVHSARKRMISNVYAKSSLQPSPALPAAPGSVLEVYELFSVVTLDVVTAHIVDLEQGSNFTDHPEVGAKWLRDYESHMPSVFQLFLIFGLGRWLVPDWFGQKSVVIEEQCLEWCDVAEAAILSGKAAESAGQDATVYGQMRSVLKEHEKRDVGTEEKDNSQLSREQRLDLASEILVHLAAGFDTSGPR